MQDSFTLVTSLEDDHLCGVLTQGILHVIILHIFLFSFSATVAIITINTRLYSSDYPVQATVVAAGNIKHMTSCGDFC